MPTYSRALLLGKPTRQAATTSSRGIQRGMPTRLALTTSSRGIKRGMPTQQVTTTSSRVIRRGMPTPLGLETSSQGIQRGIQVHAATQRLLVTAPAVQRQAARTPLRSAMEQSPLPLTRSELATPAF